MPPDRPGVTLPFYSLRLRHLVTCKASVIVSCGACRRTGTLDPIALLAARGSEFGVRDLERALRCDAMAAAGRGSPASALSGCELGAAGASAGLDGGSTRPAPTASVRRSAAAKNLFLHLTIFLG